MFATAKNMFNDPIGTHTHAHHLSVVTHGANALLDATAESGRPFDAMVVGEYERAFYGNLFESTLTLPSRRGV